jgi:hypothetical protein
LLGVPKADSHPYDELFLAMALIGRAVSERELGRTEPALASLAETLSRLRPLRERTKDSNVTHFLGRALLEQGRTLAALPDRQREAEEKVSEAIVIWEGLRQEFPKIAHYREWLGVAYEVRAGIRRGADRLEPAAADLAASRQVLELLVKESPDLPGYRGHLGRTYQALGGLVLARGNAEEAAGRLTQAAASLRGAVEGAPGNALDRRSLVEVEALQKRVQNTAPNGDRP